MTKKKSCGRKSLPDQKQMTDPSEPYPYIILALISLLIYWRSCVQGSLIDRSLLAIADFLVTVGEEGIIKSCRCVLAAVPKAVLLSAGVLCTLIIGFWIVTWWKKPYSRPLISVQEFDRQGKETTARELRKLKASPQFKSMMQDKVREQRRQAASQSVNLGFIEDQSGDENGLISAASRRKNRQNTTVVYRTNRLDEGDDSDGHGSLNKSRRSGKSIANGSVHRRSQGSPSASQSAVNLNHSRSSIH